MNIMNKVFDLQKNSTCDSPIHESRISNEELFAKPSKGRGYLLRNLVQRNE